MAIQQVEANTTFNCFLNIGNSKRQRWTKVPKGTKGILSEDGKSVILELDGGDTGEAPLHFGDDICVKTTYVYDRHLDRV